MRPGPGPQWRRARPRPPPRFLARSPKPLRLKRLRRGHGEGNASRSSSTERGHPSRTSLNPRPSARLPPPPPPPRGCPNHGAGLVTALVRVMDLHPGRRRRGCDGPESRRQSAGPGAGPKSELRFNFGRRRRRSLGGCDASCLQARGVAQGGDSQSGRPAGGSQSAAACRLNAGIMHVAAAQRRAGRLLAALPDTAVAAVAAQRSAACAHRAGSGRLARGAAGAAQSTDAPNCQLLPFEFAHFGKRKV
jgi:hypothetical protein